MRALLIANAEDADAGDVGERFRHHGFSFTECHRESPQEWPELDGHDLVLTLGSEWSVYWDHLEQEVAAEIGLVRTAHRRGVPLFGICYGFQVIAQGFGGMVRRSEEPEIGWFDIESDRPDVISAGPWLQWHYDVVEVPPVATELARSPIGPQVFAFDRVLATQFHPEATETMLRRWTAGAGGADVAARGSSRDELLARTALAVEDSRPSAERLVDWFLETVTARAA